MSTDLQAARDMGRLEAKVERLEVEVAEMKAMVTSMHETITAAKGSWRALVGVATATAAVTAGFMKLAGVLLR